MDPCGLALDYLEKPFKICKADTGALKIKFNIRDYNNGQTCCTFFLLDKACPHKPLYRIIIDTDGSVYDMQNSKVLHKFKFPYLQRQSTYNIWLTWYNDVINIGIFNYQPFMTCYLNRESEMKPMIGFIKFITVNDHQEIVDWEILYSAAPSLMTTLELPKQVDGGKLRWVKMVKGDTLPVDAMIGGFENEISYIARAEHMGSLVPGKYVKSKQLAFIPWGHQEHAKNEFEVLCGYDATWLQCCGDCIPENAVIGGRSGVRNEPLYIGRMGIKNHLVPGRVLLLYRSCYIIYIPYEGREFSDSAYEILVDNSKVPHETFRHLLCYMNMSMKPCLTEG